jgi:hypothetical protein
MDARYFLTFGVQAIYTGHSELPFWIQTGSSIGYTKILLRSIHQQTLSSQQNDIIDTIVNP